MELTVGDPDVSDTRRVEAVEPGAVTTWVVLPPSIARLAAPPPPAPTSRAAESLASVRVEFMRPAWRRALNVRLTEPGKFLRCAGARSGPGRPPAAGS